MNTILQNKWVLVAIALAAGLLLGFLFFGGNASTADAENAHAHNAANEESATIWTCAMDPQIRSSEPGTCPICGMALTPLDELNDDPLLLEMSMEAAMLAGIHTTPVEISAPEKKISLQGKVEVDERSITTQTSRYAGRIERLFIDFTGAQVRRGQKLATLYSPELVNAQKELFEAMRLSETAPQLVEAAKNKLRLWDLTDAQIDGIVQSGKPRLTLDIFAKESGIVTELMVTEGQYVSEGTPFMVLTDLSGVWVIFDAYERDLPWMKLGETIKFTIPSLPGEVFSGKITFIQPLVNAQTRTVKVRIETRNPGQKLKPGMFANGTLEANLQGKSAQITVPKSAILWTGPRSVAYVKVPDTERPTFQFREVKLGADLGSHFVIESGLAVGEELVTNGAFRIDAAAQLQRKYSMMNRPGSSGYAASIVVPESFKIQMNGLFEIYIEIKNALVVDDLATAGKQTSRLQDALKKVTTGQLDEQAESAWEEISARLNKGLSKMSQASDIEGFRKSFKPFSESFANLVEVFGVAGRTVYKDYCPMVENDKGGYWLSEFKEIRNPYFGDKMLKCGEVKDVFEANSGENPSAQP